MFAVQIPVVVRLVQRDDVLKAQTFTLRLSPDTTLRELKAYLIDQTGAHLVDQDPVVWHVGRPGRWGN
jgi:hypothetical protein